MPRPGIVLNCNGKFGDMTQKMTLDPKQSMSHSNARTGWKVKYLFDSMRRSDQASYDASGGGLCSLCNSMSSIS
jgi:hypothetical protein